MPEERICNCCKGRLCDGRNKKCTTCRTVCQHRDRRAKGRSNCIRPTPPPVVDIPGSGGVEGLAVALWAARHAIKTGDGTLAVQAAHAIAKYDMAQQDLDAARDLDAELMSRHNDDGEV